MRRAYWTASLLLILFSWNTAWSGDAARDPDPDDQKSKKFIQYAKVLSQTKRKLLKEIVENTPNPHVEGQVDEWRTLQYGGMTVVFYHTKPKGEPSRDLLSKVVVTSRKYKLPFGIRVGDKKESVLKRIGWPSKDNKAEIIYESTIGEAGYMESATLRFEKEILREIQWDFEID